MATHQEEDINCQIEKIYQSKQNIKPRQNAWKIAET